MVCVHTNACKYVCSGMHAYQCMQVCMQWYACIPMHVSMHAYQCMSACMHTNACMYTENSRGMNSNAPLRHTIPLINEIVWPQCNELTNLKLTPTRFRYMDIIWPLNWTTRRSQPESSSLDNSRRGELAAAIYNGSWPIVLLESVIAVEYFLFQSNWKISHYS